MRKICYCCLVKQIRITIENIVIKPVAYNTNEQIDTMNETLKMKINLHIINL